VAKKPTKRARFGNIRKLPSGRFQARYTGPDKLPHTAPMTFDTKGDAETWLSTIRTDIVRGLWRPADANAAPITFGEYSSAWLADRILKPRTRAHYSSILDSRLVPTFGPVPLTAITPASVARWHTLQGNAKPTMRSHAYGLLRTVLASAVADQLISVNPCHIRGAGNSKRVHKIKPATLTELETLVSAMPAKYRLMVLLASWCGLRFGELTELRRSDVDQRNGVLYIRRAVVRADGQVIVGAPKSDAGTRDVHVPPHLLPAVNAHIKEHAQFGRDGLLFPAANGGHLAPSTLYRSYYTARKKAGRDDLRFHDLRHTGAVLAASTGASLAELMARLGHSTVGAAMRYQHSAGTRDAEIAAALSVLAEADHAQQKV
jgi:integrase